MPAAFGPTTVVISDEIGTVIGLGPKHRKFDSVTDSRRIGQSPLLGKQIIQLEYVNPRYQSMRSVVAEFMKLGSSRISVGEMEAEIGV